MAGSGTVFLMYHEIELPGRALCHAEAGYVRYVISEAALRTQWSSLKNEGWHGMSVGEVLAKPQYPGVAITFDDGCETDLISAAPLLRELGFNATFYVTVGFLGTRGYLSQTQVRELSDHGFEAGCHSMTHPYLPDTSDAQLREETAGAKDHLQQITGRRVDHFSCPGGRWNHRVVTAAKQAGYQSMATSIAAANSPRTDPFKLGRVTVLRGTNSAAFMRLCRGDGLAGTRLKQITRAAAQRFLGNKLYDSVRGWLLREQGPTPFD